MSEMTLFQNNPLASSDLFKSLQDMNKNISGGGSGSATKKISIRGGRFRPMEGKQQVSVSKDSDLNVVIVNAEKIQLSGNKWEDKTYLRYTGYPGGQRSTTARELLVKNPASIIEKAVKGMLPKNKLGAELFRNLRVYAGTEHDQEAQKPKAINLNDLN